MKLNTLRVVKSLTMLDKIESKLGVAHAEFVPSFDTRD